MIKKIITKDTYAKWQKEHPEFSHISYEKYLRYWKYYVQEAAELVRDNPGGVKFEGNMGYSYVVVFDIDFKCELDFRTKFIGGTGEVKRQVTFDNPKKAKIVWKRNRRQYKVTRWLGCDYATFYRNIIGKGIYADVNRFRKIGKFGLIPSKCSEPKFTEKSLFE